MTRELLTHGARQVGRFAVVGVGNTAIDFAVTNLLFLALRPSGDGLLLLISVTACLVATANSYFWNRRWTFRSKDGAPARSAKRLFFAVAMLSLVINSSVFLFTFKQLPTVIDANDWITVNVAKLAGVVAALAVSFLGYRFGVFQPESITEFRRSFRFRPAADGFVRTALILGAIAAAVRLVYLGFTTAIFGDAVNYSAVAESLAAWRFEDANPFWSSLFCYWQALFHVVFDVVTSTILSSWIPGVLLPIPVAHVARSLYGSRAGWIAGLLTAVHPRLVEYSANGYAESFYLFAFATGVAFATVVMQRGGVRAAFGSGVAFGAYVATRNEAVLVTVAVVGLFCFAGRARSRSADDAAAPLRRAPLVVAALMGMALVVGGYMGLSQATLDTPGVFQKGSNLYKRFSELLDAESSAREVYSKDGKIFGEEAEKPPLSEALVVLAQRLPGNLRLSLEQLPGVLLSPMFLVALLLPALVANRGTSRGDELPVLAMLLFPICFYPLIQIEPRLFFAILVPVHVFGAAGLEAVCRYLEQRVRLRNTFAVVVALVVLLSLAFVIWRGRSLEERHEVHRSVATWLRGNVPAGETIIGGGYGYIAATGYLSGHPRIPMLWTEDAGELAPFLEDQQSRWLVLHESYLETYNDALLPVLEDGVPGLALRHEEKDRNGKRVQVHERQAQ